ncbi:glutamine--fructose-6-phosphate transaminase (isomerizing), partial [Tropheryma whipplei]
MCGIIGYSGPRPAAEVLLKGLERLEYRGYDSAGIAVVTDKAYIESVKKSGKLNVLKTCLERRTTPIVGSTGIGHTRWATHGEPSDRNAHPHMDTEQSLAIVHNGIIENSDVLKRELLASGKSFTSETDTEVVAHLLSDAFKKTQDLVQAFVEVTQRLEGAFAVVAIHKDQPNTIVAAKNNSPLLLGFGQGENFLASDIAAFAEYTQRVANIDQERIVALSGDSVYITDFAGHPVDYEVHTVSWHPASVDSSGWSSFMLKEIFEEPQAVENTLKGRTEDGTVILPECDHIRDDLLAIDRVVLVGCGTAAYAAMTASYSIEAWAGLPVSVELSHEFRYREPVLNSKTLAVFISQSGETMDSLMAVRYARQAGVKTISVCNVMDSSIPKESHAVIYTKAGPEVAVASTKSFVCQIVVLYLLALYLGQLRGFRSIFPRQKAVCELNRLPVKLKQVLEIYESVRQLAHWMSDSRSILFLGRHAGYPIALEAALKLKELAYIHAEGFAAGELKHGPIALIEPGQPVFVIVPSPVGSPILHAKVISNIREIKSRGARIIAIAAEGDSAVLPHADSVLRIPLTRYSFEP